MLISLVTLSLSFFFAGLKGLPQQHASEHVDETLLEDRRIKLVESLLGCGKIAYEINLDRRNTWKAIPSPARPQSSMVGSAGIANKTIQTGQNYQQDADKYCPIDQCTIPLAYDARLEYPGCSSIFLPLDEGCNCRGSWAISAASAFTDRMCIKSSGGFTGIYSAQNLLSCCTFCSQKGGCDGGDSLYAWIYIRDTGIVTGSTYGSEEGCQPYEIEPCPMEYIFNDTSYTPSCSNKCQSDMPGFLKKYKSESAFLLKDVSVTTIKREIMLEGPVSAEIKVYEDLHCYHSGIYSHVMGDFLGFKSIKLIGWGEDVSAGSYWIAANTWGPSWGEDGFFKIKMGMDENRVEFSVSGGRVSRFNSQK